MGVRGEIFSTKVSLPNRTYFFNVKENRMGDLYLNIVESKNRENGGFERQSVILFADDLQEFLKGFDESLKVMEKSVRDKKRGSGDRKEFQKPSHKNTEQNDRRAAPPGKNRYKRKSTEQRESRGFIKDSKNDSGHKARGKRIVVKKRGI